MIDEQAKVRWYVALISAVGLSTCGVLISGGGLTSGASHAEFWIYGVLVILGELLPVHVSRPEGEGTVSTSTMFTFALLLQLGIPAAVFAQCLASVGSDLHEGKPPWKIAFNAAQFTLSITAAGAVLGLLSGSAGSWLAGIPGFDESQLPAILVAGVVYFACNHAITSVGIALSQRGPLLRSLIDDIRGQGMVDVVLLGLAPVAAAAAERALVLLPVLAVPMFVLYRSASVSVERDIKAHQANHDHLTGLANRALFYERLSQVAKKWESSGQPFAIAIVDLDRFKEINDTLGHAVGDQVIRLVGRRLSSSLGEGDLVARLGGDEFAAILTSISGPGEAVTLAAAMQRALREPLVLEGAFDELTLDVEASIGVAACPEHGDDVDTLIRRADVAMYLAKGAQRDVALYDPDADADHRSPARFALVGELRRAVEEEDELVVHYQPKVDLVTGRIVGVEALVRWQHPRHGLLLPGSFIEAAERTSLIGALTRTVLAKTTVDTLTWLRAGLDVPVAVNVARRHLLDHSFPQAVEDVLALWGVPADRLRLEVAESSVVADPDRATQVLHQLKAIGVGLSLDDFGAGYSSLSHLKNLPIDELKIDRSFVAGIDRHAGDHAVVRSTIELSHRLGLTVVGEGVERPEVWRHLRGLGCDVAQGFLVARAMPAGELVRWIEDWQQSLALHPEVTFRVDRPLDVIAVSR